MSIKAIPWRLQALNTIETPHWQASRKSSCHIDHIPTLWNQIPGTTQTNKYFTIYIHTMKVTFIVQFVLLHYTQQLQHTRECSTGTCANDHPINNVLSCGPWELIGKLIGIIIWNLSENGYHIQTVAEGNHAHVPNGVCATISNHDNYMLGHSHHCNHDNYMLGKLNPYKDMCWYSMG